MRLRIGFLGLGTMGEPIANNLRKAGHELTVWNRTASRTETLVGKGARRAETPKACAEGKDVVFTCVSDEKALAAVLDGPDGVLAGLKKGDVLVDLSTSGTRAARTLGERCAAVGASLVVAPLLGSRSAAEKAQLVVVVGGPAAARERVRPALKAVSARLFEVDSTVEAALLKLCVNAVGGAMLAGFAEAVALGSSGGLALGKVLEVLQASTFHSPLYLLKGELIQAKDWETRFKTALAEKDQRLAQEAAADQGARLPVNEAVRKLLADAVGSGRGEKDLASVAELLMEWAAPKKG
jgi:3-hydroxyisobutyrate dehydrogenase-like beta-hydroxyacid dehydrogenase